MPPKAKIIAAKDANANADALRRVEPTTSLPSVDVRALVGEGREAVIMHKGDRYRLRITANDKLILTK